MSKILIVCSPNQQLFLSTFFSRIQDITKSQIQSTTIDSFPISHSILSINQTINLKIQTDQSLEDILVVFIKLNHLFLTEKYFDLILFLCAFYEFTENEFDKRLKAHSYECQNTLLNDGNLYAYNRFFPDYSKLQEFKFFKNSQEISKILQKYDSYLNSDIEDNFYDFYTVQFLVEEINQSYKSLIDEQMSKFYLIPMRVNPVDILEKCYKYFILEGIENQILKEQILENVRNEVYVQAQQDQSIIDDFNEENCYVLTKIIDYIEEQLKTNQELEKSSLKKALIMKISKDLEETQIPKQLERRVEDYKQELIFATEVLIEHSYQMLQEGINDIIEQELDFEKFDDYKQDLIEQTMCRIVFELKGFAELQNDYIQKLYMRMKNYLKFISEGINHFLLQMSEIAQKHMKYLNDLLEEYKSLANVRTYYVLQYETSQVIMDEVHQLLNRSWFFRIEFSVLEDELITNGIKYFYSYSSLEQANQFETPMKAKDFKQSLQLMGESKPILGAGIQIVKDSSPIIRYIKVNDKYQSLFQQHSLIRTLKQQEEIHFYLYNSDQYHVIAAQDIINYKIGRIAISLILAHSDNCQIHLVLQLNNQNSSLLLTISTSLNLSDWDSQSKITYFDPSITLSQFIKEKSNQFSYYSSKVGQPTRTETFNQFKFNNQNESSQFVNKDLIQDKVDDLQRYKDYLKKRRVVTQQMVLTQGPQNALSGGTIGAGIGCLIVDSLDKTIPWNDKLKRAGYASLTTGLVGAATQIPLIGLLIQQAIFAYGIRTCISNKVISKTQKAKNIGHMTVQSSVGLGSAVAGQLLIPVPVLGAIIGGTLGGVAIGFYQKIVVNKAKSSMLKMLDEIQARIMDDGLVLYDDKVVKILKINPEHFHQNKPKVLELTDSQWLTIVLVYLVNEIYYIFTLTYEEKYAEIVQKGQKEQKEEKLKKKLKELETEFEKMELTNVKWEPCRNYIHQNKINTLNMAINIGQFVNGMIANFKL